MRVEESSDNIDGLSGEVPVKIDLVRLDLATGYFGVLSNGGTIRTFFRPNGDAMAYFWSQF